MSDNLIVRLERAARRNQMDKGDHDAIHAAVAALTAERQAREQAEQALGRFGFRRCDAPACNCNGWHGGHSAQRLVEIGDALTDANVETNGRTLLDAVKAVAARAEQAEQERDLARRDLEWWKADRDEALERAAHALSDDALRAMALEHCEYRRDHSPECGYCADRLAFARAVLAAR
jgi:hypothetical protein